MPAYKIVTIIMMFLVLAWQVANVAASTTTYKKAIYTPSITSSSGGGGYVFNRKPGKGYVFDSRTAEINAKNYATQRHNNTVRDSIIISLATIAIGGFVLAYKKQEKKGI